MRAIAMRLVGPICAGIAALTAAMSADAQGKKPDSTGFAGIPGNKSAETDIPFFSQDVAKIVDDAIQRLKKDAANCDRSDYDETVRRYEFFVNEWPRYGDPKHVRDAANMKAAEEKFPPFPKDCLPPAIRQIIRRVLGHVYFIGGANVPLGFNGSVSGVDTFFGPGAYLVDNRTASTGNATGFAGLRARVETGFDFSTQLAMCDTDSPSTFGALRFFLETGVQSAFGAQSSLQAFQRVSGTPQAFGASTINENFQVPIMAGITAPVGSAGAGRPAVLLDVYGGITLDSWTQTLQGRESGAPAGPGFFAQNRRFTVDPTVGVGMRVPLGDVGGLPGVTVGVNAEFQFRPGSVVTAPSQNFPSETYYGTINPSTNMAVMARIGIPLGGH